MQGGHHFHTTIRTIGKREIFSRFEDKALFLGILGRFAYKYNIQILEFAISDWQVLLLYQGSCLSESGKFTGELQQNFSYWWNRFNCNKDKLFVGAKTKLVATEEDLIKCGFSILHKGIIHKAVCSYCFHFNLMRSLPLSPDEKKNFWKIKVMFEAINRSRSSVKNRCPAVMFAASSGSFSAAESFSPADSFTLANLVAVDTFYLDRHFTEKEFRTIVQKSGLLLSDPNL